MDAGSPEESRYSLTLQLAAASRRYLSHRVERKPPAPLLRGIEVRNFRNIRAAKISLAPITVLIGENNVGKTNFLTAAGCLFPVILEERLTNFGATIGDTGALNAVEHFVSLNSEVRSAQLGALTSEGTFWVDLYNRHTLLQASYLREVNLLAVLLTSGSLMRRRWLSKPIGRIDGRRLGQNSDGPRAQDYKIGELLQAEFIGSARIALNLNPEAEGPQLAGTRQSP